MKGNLDNQTKIGLVSFYKDPNYGTMLQAYALAASIRNLGKECEYIQYRNHSKSSHQKLVFRSVIKQLLTNLGLINNEYEFKYYDNKEFRNIKGKYQYFVRHYIPVSRKTYYIDSIIYTNEEYSNFIVGSDQTWSRFMTRNLEQYLFLGFVTDTMKKQSYAPSIGTTNIDNDYRNKLIETLSSFSNLSCREPENSKLLSILLGKQVESVIDPTLLLKKDDWISIVDNNYSLPSEKYILCYILGVKDCISSFAEKLGEEKGLSVYYILTRPEYLTKKKVLCDVGPRDFVNLIANAEYVVTDSFHGTIFSINLNTNFYSFAKRIRAEGFNDNDRILSILKPLGLQNRFHDDSDDEILPDIDFKSVMSKLEGLKLSSMAYLKKIVNNNGIQ